MPSVIRSLTEYSNEKQLWMDIGSLKASTTKAMLKSKASVVGLHPLFAPNEYRRESLWLGNTVVCCLCRSTEKWGEWLDHFFEETMADIKDCGPQTHDRLMLGVQNMPHLATLAQASAIESLGLSPFDIVEFSTRFSEHELWMIARMFRHDPRLYSDIQMGNPETLEMLDALINSLSNWRRIIAKGSEREFVTEFKRIRTHFTEDFLKKVEGTAIF
jgi:prephenate dehydrogenase